jgi:hypothetical protein
VRASQAEVQDNAQEMLTSINRVTPELDAHERRISAREEAVNDWETAVANREGVLRSKQGGSLT